MYPVLFFAKLPSVLKQLRVVQSRCNAVQHNAILHTVQQNDVKHWSNIEPTENTPPVMARVGADLTMGIKGQAELAKNQIQLSVVSSNGDKYVAVASKIRVDVDECCIM